MCDFDLPRPRRRRCDSSRPKGANHVKILTDGVVFYVPVRRRSIPLCRGYVRPRRARNESSGRTTGAASFWAQPSAAARPIALPHLTLSLLRIVKQSRDVTACMKHTYNFYGLRLWIIYDQVRKHRPEFHALIGQVFPRVARLGPSRHKSYSLAYLTQHISRYANAGLFN